MRRSTGFSGLFRLVRAGSAGAAISAAILSCSDNTAPKTQAGLDPSSIHLFQVPASEKQAYKALVAQELAGNGANIVADASSVSSAIKSANAGATSVALTATGPAYTETHVDFAPEADPINPIPIPDNPVIGGTDDGWVSGIPMGFDFTFYGNTYSKLNLYFNGFVTFGTGVNLPFWRVDGIPFSGDPNNMIALAWSDWFPGRAPGSITYETRGEAPNRRFLVQFKGVPESGGSGHLTAQLVLHEGSNKITMYVTQMNITNGGNRITQGIENADGTEALVDSVQIQPGLWSPRSRGFFSLANDAIEFTPAHVNLPPVVVAPPNITVNTDPGVCTAAVNAGVATATDDADGTTVAGARADALTLDAAYPRGATSVTWTATDAEGLTATASQSVTVSDKQSPAVTAPADISARTDRGSSMATVAVGEATALDNCGTASLSGARSDGVPLSAGYPVGVTTITWTAADTAGNVGSAVQTVTVAGNAAPVLTVPSAISVNTDPGVCAAQVNPGTATATDDVEGTVVSGARSDNLSLTSAFPKGVTTIMWTARDADGFTASASQTVTVSDKEKPSVISPANISVANDAGMTSASVAVGSAAAADNCPNVVVSGARSDGAALGSSYPIGITTITWSASDASGNTASAVQTVAVRDGDAPNLIVPADFQVNAADPNGSVVNFSVSATDNVGVTSLSCDRASGSVFPIGNALVTCVAIDAQGNRTSRSFTVQVIAPAPIDPQARINDLIAYVRSLHLPNGTTNPLVNQLRSAFRPEPGEKSCQKLQDFIETVGNNGPSITAGQSTYMIGEALGIMEDMGCSRAAHVSAQRDADQARGRTNNGRDDKVNGRDKQSGKR